MSQQTSPRVSCFPVASKPLRRRSAVPRALPVLCLLTSGCLLVIFSQVVAAQQRNNPAAPPNAARGAVADPFPEAESVPRGILSGGSEWLNTSQPISMDDLKGKIVLVDFWTYCCINCIHILPDLKYLEEKYDKQLVVIGVHSAKFDNEKVSANIRNAIMRYEINHPVVNDSDLQIWRRFGTQSWPTQVLIDAEGRFIGARSGEGQREVFDATIGRLVEYHRATGTLDETPLSFALEAAQAPRTPLRYPGKVTADVPGNRLFISDSNHNRIVVTTLTGELLTIIGSGRQGMADGDYATAEFNLPQGTALLNNQLYVADTENHLLRVIDLTSETVTTLAGTGQQAPHSGQPPGGSLRQTALNSPWSLAWARDTLFIAMAGPHQIWAYFPASQRILPYAGSGREDVINGPLAKAAFAQPSELVANASGSFLYVVDSEGSAVRQVPTDPSGVVSTVAGTSELPRGRSLFAFGDTDGRGAKARFQHPLGIAINGNILYVADSYNHKIRQINLENRNVTTWIGSGQPGASLDPPMLDEPGGIAMGDGQLFIADTNNHRICVADLSTGTLQEIQIDGLTPPNPPAIRTSIDTSNAVTMELQTIPANATLEFNVQLLLPEGYKLNELAPVTWELQAPDGQTIIAADGLDAREEAQVNEAVATFSVPLTQQPGESRLTLQMSYGYCASNSSLCRLAMQTWQIPVSVAPEHQTTAIQLSFPAVISGNTN